MTKEVELGGFEITAGAAVAHESVVVVAVPKFLDDIDELGGPLVALAVAKVSVTPEIESFRGVGGSHDVPSNAAVADVIKRGKFSGDMVRLVITCGCCAHEANVLRHRSEPGKKREWLEIGHVLRPPREAFNIAVARSDGISKKNEIEFGSLCRVRQPDIMFEVG